MSVGLQLAAMHQIFKKIGADDLVTLLVDDKEDDSHIYITVRSGSLGSKTIKYKVGQILIANRDRVEIPERDYPCGSFDTVFNT